MNFWASWCADCRVEHGALAAAWDRYRDQGVVLLGVPFQDRSSASAAYVDKYGGDWPQLTDPDERTALAYGVYGVPGPSSSDRTGAWRPSGWGRCRMNG